MHLHSLYLSSSSLSSFTSSSSPLSSCYLAMSLQVVLATLPCTSPPSSLSASTVMGQQGPGVDGVNLGERRKGKLRSMRRRKLWRRHGDRRMILKL